MSSKTILDCDEQLILSVLTSVPRVRACFIDAGQFIEQEGN